MKDITTYGKLAKLTKKLKPVDLDTIYKDILRGVRFSLEEMGALRTVCTITGEVVYGETDTLEYARNCTEEEKDKIAKKFVDNLLLESGVMQILLESYYMCGCVED